MTIHESSWKLINDKSDEYDEHRRCKMPKPNIASDKDAVLIIGLNPAGGEEEAERDKKTGSLFLNYYKEFDKIDELKDPNDPGKRLISKVYFKPIYDVIKSIIGEKFAWEWCNQNFADIETSVRKVKADVNPDTIHCLRECYEKYKDADYQVIVRDLVYYHQTSKFKELLLPTSNKEVKAVVKAMIDEYVNLFANEGASLKFIYVNSAMASHYIRAAFSSQKLEDFGGIYFGKDGKKVPILFGSALNGKAAMDVYSKERLKSAMKKFI